MIFYTTNVNLFISEATEKSIVQSESKASIQAVSASQSAEEPCSKLFVLPAQPLPKRHEFFIFKFKEDKKHVPSFLYDGHKEDSEGFLLLKKITTNSVTYQGLKLAPNRRKYDFQPYTLEYEVPVFTLEEIEKSQENLDFVLPKVIQRFMERSEEEQEKVDKKKKQKKSGKSFKKLSETEFKEQLEIHQIKYKLSRNSQKKFPCDICGDGTRYSSWNMLGSHIEINHYDMVKFGCFMCGCDFTRKSSLYYHFSCHFGVFKYECEIEGCDSKHRHLDHLKDHMATHGYCSKCTSKDHKTMVYIGPKILEHIKQCHPKKQLRLNIDMEAIRRETELGLTAPRPIEKIDAKEPNFDAIVLAMDMLDHYGVTIRMYMSKVSNIFLIIF